MERVITDTLGAAARCRRRRRSTCCSPTPARAGPALGAGARRGQDGGQARLRPDKVAARGARLTAELAKIAAGRSEIEPARRRPALQGPGVDGEPGLQAPAAGLPGQGRTVDELICDADLDWRSERRVRFAAENVLDALAPTNCPLTEPGGAEGDDRHGRAQLRARRGATSRATCPRRRGSRRWSTRRLRGRREPRASRRARSCCARRCSSSSSTRRRRRRCASGRCCSCRR